jgi:hypothetical protein
MLKFAQILGKFRGHQSGAATLHTALLFGAVAMALSVLLTPQLKNAADAYAENSALGIDRVMTGSISKDEKTYTIRKSVLDK